MLTSSSQYLRPEYLSPLPTTLDAKKSPLALLAQTCSNIGADNPNNKPIIPALEKSKDHSSDSKKDKSPLIISDDHSNSKPAFKPYESVIKKEDSAHSDSAGKKTPNSKACSPAHRSSPAATNSSRGSPANSENGRSSSQNPAKSEPVCSIASPSTSSLPTSTTLCSSQNTLSGLGYGSSASLGIDLARSDAAKESLSHLGLSAYKALNGLNPLSNCTGCGPLPGHPMDMSHAYAGGAQSSLLKAGGYSLGTAALSPYVGYARVKSANGGTTLVPVCRDPYCTNCQYNMHSAQLASCPSGCTQCTHDRIGTLSGLGHGLMPGLTGSAAAMAAVAAANGMPGLGYPHTMLPRPIVCSWMVGDTYCGKRFTTSEELLLHLKTHTSLSTSDAPLSLISPAFSLASSSLNAACHMHYTSAASLTSPAGLRRTYPTSLSPVSSLSAASRFHPYKPSLSSLQGPPVPLTHPSLGMYYPYGLYGQRLGPPVHP